MYWALCTGSCIGKCIAGWLEHLTLVIHFKSSYRVLSRSYSFWEWKLIKTWAYKRDKKHTKKKQPKQSSWTTFLYIPLYFHHFRGCEPTLFFLSLYLLQTLLDVVFLSTVGGAQKMIRWWSIEMMANVNVMAFVPWDLWNPLRCFLRISTVPTGKRTGDD